MAIAEHDTARELARLDELIDELEREFLARQARSRELTERARGSLPGGVTSNWQISRPQPIWISHGKGSKVWDVDGNEYVDLHNGYGVMAVGHAHPRIVAAVSDRIARGSHFAQPTEDSIAVAENLRRRFGLPLWRFGNSGTEATMDAVHLMRAATGRSKIVKIEGTYHGHHDSVQVSVYNEGPEIGPAERPNSVAASTGIPQEIVDLTLVVPFNDLSAAERVFAEHPGEIAGMILEPIVMNIGMIPPEPGYLEGLRELTRRHDAFLVYDEVKTGLTMAPGGATELLGVTPDLVCLAKAMGGGLPCGALGGSAEAMGLIAEGEYEQVGTFNGNPLTMAAARATVTEILDDGAYAHWTSLRTQMVEGCEGVIREYGLQARVVAFGAKGCISFHPTPIRNYREFLEVDNRYSHAHWLTQLLGGVFLPPWGKAEQWMLSVQHTPEDADRFVQNFETLAKSIRS
ncbi:MAG TPA: aspartate aminotransferase family protein [Actinomycetota bacterium]